MPTKNIRISDRQARFIKQSIHAGQFRDTSEAVRAGLSLLQQRSEEDKLKLRALRKIAAEGFGQIDAGNYETIEANSIDAFIDRIAAKAKKPRR